jgi:DNA polymerase IV
VPRKIIHIDMDAFYASVEQRDEPSLRGLPLAVGGAGERGVVAAASYEARRFGVRSAMSSAVARRLCPGLRFVPPRFDVYKAVSLHIRALFARYTALIEPLSLDEAYLDVTHSPSGLSATAIAQRLRASIREETRLTASAGVSYNKFLAKLASDQNKPDGLCVVTPREGPAFVERLPVGRFHGVGPVTAAKMNRLGIFTGRDLREHGQAFLQEHFGKAGDYYYQAARGEDHRPVRADQPRKSIGSEETFETDLEEAADLLAGLMPSVDSVWEHIERHGTRGRTLTLKVRYADFRQVTRSRTLPEPVTSRDTLVTVGTELLRALLPVDRGVRLLGLTLSSLETARGDEDGQLGLEL